MLELHYNEYSDEEKKEIDSLIYELHLSEFMSSHNLITHVCDGHDVYDLSEIRDYMVLWELGRKKYGITWSTREYVLRELNDERVKIDSKKYLIKWPDIT